jgi:NAD(P)-dependent dehydrogenase (short-subunit alcohol dehydrogenase family)
MVTTPPSSKTIILTGGTRGLGWEMAEALIDAGHCVVITGQQHGPHLGALQDQLNQRAGAARALALQADVGQWADCERVVQQTLNAFGRVDGLVNNAGLGMRAIRDNFLQDPPLFWQAAPEAFADRAFVHIGAGVRTRFIPWQMGVVASLLRWLPDALFDRLLAGRPRKRRQHE